jgi:hypothetical protein
MNRITATLDRYFYFFMSLVIAAVVVYGFSHTVDKRLIHANPPRPTILYLHAAVFSGWVIFLILQSALIRMHKVWLHRLIGWFGVVLGAAIPVLGVSTAIVMAHFKMHYFHTTDDAAGLMFSFLDMCAFSIPFVLAVWWRKKPELHRRLILVASCALTSAAFARFPSYVLPPGLFYVDLDVLILAGWMRDLISNKRIHTVYLGALPLFALAQALVMYTSDWPYWIRIGNAILR